ncbi:MAG: hypothetical protein HOP29_18510 [Phycisphaerales bacterium]|nr:hypothetical protein [Phycisphaerales bacterium]
MRALMWIILVGAAALIVVGAAARRFMEPAGASSVKAAVTICVVVAVAAMAPMALAARRRPAFLLPACAAAILIRLFATLGVGLWYANGFAADKPAFTTAMVVSYLVLLAAETGVACHFVLRYWRPDAAKRVGT